MKPKIKKEISLSSIGIRLRHALFETNSSSQHSIAISKSTNLKLSCDDIYNSFPYNVKRDRVMDFSDERQDLLEFHTAPFKVLNSFFDKLCYVLASFDYIWTDDQYDAFIKVIKTKYAKWLKEVKFRKREICHEDDVSIYYHGSVDHQSSGLLRDFLEYKNIDVYTFLESSEYIVLIDGDSNGLAEKLLDNGIISTADGKLYTPNYMYDIMTPGAVKEDPTDV